MLLADLEKMSRLPQIGSFPTSKHPHEAHARYIQQMLAALPLPLANPIDTKIPDDQRQLVSLALFDRDSRGVLSPVGQFLLQEVRSLNQLLEAVRGSLEDVLSGLLGGEPMTRDRSDILDALGTNQVPPLWRSRAFPGDGSLHHLLSVLHAKVQFVAGQITQGQPRSHWLPGYFAPHRLFSALLQEHARATSECIDELLLEFEIDPAGAGNTPPSSLSPESGARLSGLVIEGAQWNEAGGCVEELGSEVSSFATLLPDIIVRVARKEPPLTGASRLRESLGGGGVQKQEKFSFPVFLCASRLHASSWGAAPTEPVTSVSLPISQGSRALWLQRNTALFCKTLL